MKIGLVNLIKFLNISIYLVTHDQPICTDATAEPLPRIDTAIHHEFVPNTTTIEIGRTHERGKTYLATRMPHSTKETSNFRLKRIILPGDIEINPRPTGKRVNKYPCKECRKNVRNHRDAILCVECNIWSHAKCLGMPIPTFKYYLDNPDLDRTCSLCSLPFNTTSDIDFTDFIGENDLQVHNLSTQPTTYFQANNNNCEHANEEPINPGRIQLLMKDKPTQVKYAYVISISIGYKIGLTS